LWKNVEADVDALFIMNATDPQLDMTFFYLTGLTGGLFESTSILVHKDGNMEMFLPWLEEETAKKCDAELHVFKSREERWNVLAEELKPYKRLGINYKEITHDNVQMLKKHHPSAEFTNIAEAIRKTRLIKDDAEIELMKRSCDISSRAAENIVDYLKPGVKEYEIAAELAYMMQKMGAGDVGFETISAFGPNSTEAHYHSGDVALKDGDIVLLDYGAKYQKYISDITRTFVCGRSSPELDEMYTTVLEMQRVALDLIKEGANGKDVDAAVRRHIDGTKYKGRFTHSTGHSIGLATHDGGVLSHLTDQPLKEGMVFTVEPGVYIPDFGGVRIEDDVLVKKNGLEILTSAPKEELIVL
jgi:Xaa-Pro dipeptidase